MKKNDQLGINFSTATHRLRTDILFEFVKRAGHKCYRCGGELTRDTFSIEHKIAWLDSDNPIKLFFDIENIGYSHKSCNFSQRYIPNKIYITKEEKRNAQRRYQRESNARNYSPEKRSAKYLRTGN